VEIFRNQYGTMSTYFLKYYGDFKKFPLVIMWQQQVSISFQKLKAFVHTSLQGLFIIIIIISFFLSFFLVAR